MPTCKCSLVAGLFKQISPVPKTFGQLSLYSLLQVVKAAHSTSSKRKLADENDLNKGNEIIDQILKERKSSQAYGSPKVLANRG